MGRRHFQWQGAGGAHVCAAANLTFNEAKADGLRIGAGHRVQRNSKTVGKIALWRQPAADRKPAGGNVLANRRRDGQEPWT